MLYRGRELTPVEELVIYGKFSTRSCGIRALDPEPSVPSGAVWNTAERAMLGQIYTDGDTRALCLHVEAKLLALPAILHKVLVYAIVGRGEEWADTRRDQLCLDTANEVRGREWEVFWRYVLPEVFGEALSRVYGARLIERALSAYQAA